MTTRIPAVACGHLPAGHGRGTGALNVLHLHRAERADRLVAALAELLAEPAGDPFQPELVAVHSRGIERWLAQELSTRLGTSDGLADGVCANVEFPFPWQVLGRVLAATHDLELTDPRSASGASAGTRVELTDPWAPPRVVWPLLEVTTAHLDDDRLAPLRAHLGDDPDDPSRRGRRFRAVRHVADLFDRYAVHRPEMLRRWAAGEAVDGTTTKPLPGDLRWQFELWRALRAHIGVDSLPERLDSAIAALRDGRGVPGLPPRLALFGLTALPASYVDVLAALATTYEVHLFLLHPSPALWAAVADAHAGERAPAGPRPREQDPTRELPRHPLLASWGRDGREMQLVLARAGAAAQTHHPLDEHSRTLLAHVQAGVRGNTPPPGPPATDDAPDERISVRPGDRSVQVHACHGRTRQVEVLRDALLHLLAADDDLEPRDIVVMCPDIETFAPIIEAVFGAAVDVGDGASGLPDLRVRLADRSLRQTNPVLRVVADLLALADGRLAASEVLDLAGREPVRRRFRLDDEALERFEEWVVEACIRWGLDGEHRAAFGLGGVEANTWRAGLDRLLLGIAMADEDDRLIGGTVPLDDVEGGDVDLAGRLAELLARLDEAVDALGADQPVETWLEAFREVALRLTATAAHERWQHLQLERILGEVRDEAAGCPVRLALGEVRSLLEDRLAGRPSRANHRTGDLTVCTLVPMRSVPHKVVCLLGMDDAAFPRRVVGDGDDLVDRDPLVGDRDPRTEDRQLLLDALLAAGSHLVVTYTGRDERTNEPLPPAVPIGELLDCLEATARTADGQPATRQVHVEHPLQATADDNFTPGALRAGDRPWGFDPVALAGARARAAGPAPRAEFLASPLAPLAETEVDVGALVDLLTHPARAFLRRRLHIVVPGEGEEPGDAIPVELGALEEWQVGQRLLDARLAGTDPARWEAAERARGRLPPGPLADAVLAEIGDTCASILEVARGLCDLDAPRAGLEVAVPLPDGRTLVGTVPDVCGDVVLTIGYGRVRARQRITAWVRLLAATAMHPDRPLRAVTVGRHPGSQSARTGMRVCLSVLGETPEARRNRALDELMPLLDLYDRGLRAPLPMPCKTALAYAEAVHADGGKDPEHAAERVWTTQYRYPQEDHDSEHRIVYDGVLGFEELLAQAPWDDEGGDGWCSGEHSRFGRCARRLWDPILAAEEVEEW